MLALFNRRHPRRRHTLSIPHTMVRGFLRSMHQPEGPTRLARKERWLLPALCRAQHFDRAQSLCLVISSLALPRIKATRQANEKHRQFPAQQQFHNLSYATFDFAAVGAQFSQLTSHVTWAEGPACQGDFSFWTRPGTALTDLGLLIVSTLSTNRSCLVTQPVVLGHGSHSSPGPAAASLCGQRSDWAMT